MNNLTKFHTILFLFFLHFLHPENYLHYNGTIDLQFRPINQELHHELQHLQNDENESPTIIENKNEIVNKGDGFDILLNKSKKNISDTRDAIYNQLLEQGIEGAPGIFIFYNGFATMSDKNGKAFLPKLHDTKKLTVIITLEIIPLANKKIPHKFITSTEYQSAWYEMKYTEDENDATGEWNIKKVPSQKNIPDNALIIIGDPQKMYFGASNKIPSSQNILLPDILCTVEAPTASLYSSFALPVLQYFKPLGYKLRESEEGKQIHFVKGIITGETIESTEDDSDNSKNTSSANIPTGYSTGLM